MFLFCVFEGPPKLLRLYGTGSILTPGDADHDVLAARFPDHRGARAVIRVELDRAQTSCRIDALSALGDGQWLDEGRCAWARVVLVMREVLVDEGGAGDAGGAGRRGRCWSTRAVLVMNIGGFDMQS